MLHCDTDSSSYVAYIYLCILLIFIFLCCYWLFLVGFIGPSYEQLGSSARCAMQADSLCFDKVIMRVRRNASDNMEMMTVASTTHPILSLPTNVSLNSTLEQSDVSSRHWPATQLPPNSTLLPDKAADNATHILDILEASNILCLLHDKVKILLPLLAFSFKTVNCHT